MPVDNVTSPPAGSAPAAEPRSDRPPADHAEPLDAPVAGDQSASAVATRLRHRLALPAFLRTTTFRLSALAAALFAASSAFILVFVYAATASAINRRVDRALEAEVAAITAVYTPGGLNRVNQEVVRRSLDSTELLYLLAYPRGVRISGNLNALPDQALETEGGVRFTYARPLSNEESADQRARGAVTVLPGGYRLLVAQDVEDEARALGRIANAGWTAMGLVLSLGLVSGVIVSRRFNMRLEALNAVARDVMAGDLSRRAPRSHTMDELDALSANINAMLEKIEQLMMAMRHAGDAIAHDLRSPLTRLRNRLENTRMDPSLAEEALGAAVEDADELLSTFNAVLRIARLEAGERRGALTRLNAQDIVADLGELYEPLCEEQRLSFAMESEEALFVLGDRGLLSQAVANLLDNAAKYTPAGGAVVLRARLRRSGEAEISVTDTGPGIPLESRDRVRQRFVRLDKSRSSTGVGLGLSLVQAVAEMHRGRLELDDGPGMVDGVGPGLRAAIVLPLDPGG